MGNLVGRDDVPKSLLVEQCTLSGLLGERWIAQARRHFFHLFDKPIADLVHPNRRLILRRRVQLLELINVELLEPERRKSRGSMCEGAYVLQRLLQRRRRRRGFGRLGRFRLRVLVTRGRRLGRFRRRRAILIVLVGNAILHRAECAVRKLDR